MFRPISFEFTMHLFEYTYLYRYNYCSTAILCVSAKGNSLLSAKGLISSSGGSVWLGRAAAQAMDGVDCSVVIFLEGGHFERGDDVGVLCPGDPMSLTCVAWRARTLVEYASCPKSLLSRQMESRQVPSRFQPP